MLTKLTIMLMFFLIFAPGCTNSRLMQSSALDSGEIVLRNYKYVTIYDSLAASFIELELEDLFESVGFSVIGENDADKRSGSSILGVRYVEDLARNAYGNVISYNMTVLLEDYASDRTLLTATASSTASRSSAWKAVKKELATALAAQGVDERLSIDNQ